MISGYDAEKMGGVSPSKRTIIRSSLGDARGGGLGFGRAGEEGMEAAVTAVYKSICWVFDFSSSLASELIALCCASDLSDRYFKAGETDWRRRALKDDVVSDSRTIDRW